MCTWTPGGRFLVKERAFIAFSWIPKATVQAAIGGLALRKAKEENLSQEYIDWGLAILTTAVFAIVISAPAGAIMINTLGKTWLNHDVDVTDEELQKQIDAIHTPYYSHIGKF